MAHLEFNIADYPDLLAIKEANKVLPVGIYRAHVVDSQKKTSGAGHEYIELTFALLGTDVNVADDPKEAHAGRKVWENLNLYNPNEKARAMAMLTLGSLLQHTGVFKMTDTRELHGISVLIKLKVQENDPTRNCIDGKPWAAGIMPDPNIVVDNAVRQAIPQAAAVWGAPVAQPQAAAVYPPNALPPGHINRVVDIPQQAQPAALPSPHAYPDGPEAGPVNYKLAQAQQMAAQYQQPQAAPVQPGPNGNTAPASFVETEELPF